METETKSLSTQVVTITRWLLFGPVVLIQAGAFLESEYITGVTGLVFCFFLTVHQSKVVASTKRPYFLVFAMLAILFLVGSYIDMKYV
jgi:hypothetical protein